MADLPMQPRKRIVWIDVAKAIGIYLVIVGHIFMLSYYSPRRFIFLFHMPLFFFLGGLTFNDKESIRAIIVKGFWGIIVPALAWNIVYAFAYSFIANYDSPVLFVKQALSTIASIPTKIWFRKRLPNDTVWFLFALYYCRVAMFLLAKKRLIILHVAVWLALFLLLAVGRARNYCYTGSAVIAFPFFVCGYYVFRNRAYFSKVTSFFNRPGTWQILLVILSLAVLATARFWYGLTSLASRIFGRAGHAHFQSVISMYFLAFLGIGVVIVISRWLSTLKIGNSLAKIGGHTLVIMCAHKIMYDHLLKVLPSEKTVSGHIARHLGSLAILFACYALGLFLDRHNVFFLTGKRRKSNKTMPKQSIESSRSQ